jgi:cytochrome c oxidase subunit 2
MVSTAALLAGCSHKSPSMLDAKGSEASRIAGIWWLMFALAIGVYVVVAGCITLSILRGRRRRAGTASRRSEGLWLWLGGLVGPVIVLLVIAVVTVQTTAALRKPGRDPLRVDVAGEDWWWRVHYTGTSIDTANEIHLPTGRPIEIRLTSDNVVHSFWVPQLAGKMDVIPGQRNTLRFTVNKPGVYRGQCAEFCGLQHANMAFWVIAESPGLFERWLTDHANPTLEPASETAAQGQVVFQRQACAGCHTIRGTTARGTRGPDLTDFGSRRSIGSGAADNTPANLRQWITDAPSIKPGVLMPPITLSGADARSIVAYLESLK